MEKIYEVDKLLKPIKITEQESTDKDKEAEEAQATEEKQPAENNNEKTEKTDNENTEQAQEKKPEEQEKKSEEPEKNQPAQDNSQINQQQKSLYKMNSELTNCAMELDTLYTNNNLKKYGMGVDNAYKGVGRFIWPAVGIGLAATVIFGGMKGIIPVKKILPKIPLIGKLFTGDKMAINTIQNSLIMAGTGKATQAIYSFKLPSRNNQMQQMNPQPTPVQPTPQTPAPTETVAQPETNTTTPNNQPVQNNANQATNTEQPQLNIEDVKKRIADNTATNEDMDFAYKQWKAGTYKDVDENTLKYLQLLDQGKTHEEIRASLANNTQPDQANQQTTTPQQPVASQPQPTQQPIKDVANQVAQVAKQ
jgi:hypothetical protein